MRLPRSLQGLPPGETRVCRVPPRDGVLAEAPAEEDLVAVALGGEIHETGFGIAHDDAESVDLAHRAPGLLRGFEELLARVSSAVARRRGLHLILPLGHRSLRVAQRLQQRHENGQRGVRLVDRESLVVTHRITDGTCSRERTTGAPSTGSWTPRRSTSTAPIPIASAGAT